MSTPPYGAELRNDGNRRPGANRDGRTAPEATPGPEGTGDGTRPARQAYPQDSHQATGSYQSPGGYQGTGSSQANGSSNGSGGYPGRGQQAGSYPVGGYPGNGHRGNGHRAPYDPRDDYRRLTHQH